MSTPISDDIPSDKDLEILLGLVRDNFSGFMQGKLLCALQELQSSRRKIKQCEEAIEQELEYCHYNEHQKFRLREALAALRSEDK